MRTTLLAVALATAGAIAAPLPARSADQAGAGQAQAATMADQHEGEGHGMRGHDGPGMHGWPMMRHMMMHGMMRGDPQERCVDRLARRAARRAYVEVKLDLTAEQRPLWDNVQNAAKGEEQKERQLCDTIKPGGSSTLLDRMDRTQQFLSARLDGLRAAKPAVQALYRALTPEQQAVLDHPFHRQ